MERPGDRGGPSRRSALAEGQADRVSRFQRQTIGGAILAAGILIRLLTHTW
jgi:hypothetical protein